MGILLTPSNLTLHKSLDAPLCRRETCRGYKYRRAGRPEGTYETFAQDRCCGCNEIGALFGWPRGVGTEIQRHPQYAGFRQPCFDVDHEEVTRAAITVLMPVFNNLVQFDQHKERETIETIVPDLAESWAWSEDGKELTSAEPWREMA